MAAQVAVIVDIGAEMRRVDVQSCGDKAYFVGLWSAADLTLMHMSCMAAAPPLVTSDRMRGQF